MNMIATQNCNVFLPKWVVLSFCLCFCSLTRPAIMASHSTRWCFKGFGGLKCHWCLIVKKESELGCFSVFCPFSQPSVQASRSPSPLFRLLSYSMRILKEYFNSGVWQEAGCAVEWMRSRLCVGSCAELMHGVRRWDISPPEQQPPRERTPHPRLTFFLAWLLNMYIFL